MSAQQLWAAPPAGVVAAAAAPLPDVNVTDQLLPVALPEATAAGQLPPQALYEPTGVEVAAVAPPAEAYPPSITAADHRARISDAMQLPDGAERDAALIAALRGVSAEVMEAEEEHARAAKRVETAKEMFDWATGALSGYSNAKEPRGEEPRKRGRKRKGDEEPEVNFEEQFRPPVDGPLLPPMVATSAEGMSAEQVAAHRDAFYRKLCGVPYAELGSYTPPAHLVNLKNQQQLDEYVYITKNWATGTDTMDVMEFRRKHKSFYTKMKISKANIGRRTGHHLRDLAGAEGKQVFCRLGKDDESLMYVSVEQLFDAIWEIHVKTGHRGWQACKKIVNVKYANVSGDPIKCFIETCPICIARKGGSPKRQRVEYYSKTGEYV
ncbi:hypothetical protein ACHAXT_009972 [Thalassiosira profunda]